MRRNGTKSWLLAPGLAVVLVASACGGGDEYDNDAAVVEDSAATAAPAQATLTDPQIAMIVVTANSADSAAGELAQQKGESEDVKSFGAMMVKDHGAVNKQAVALAQRLNVTPEESDVSRSLKQDADQNMQNLQGLSGAAFDKAYIDHEVTLHQNVLDAIDNQLVPNAQNAELKQTIQNVRPAIAAHLDRAKEIQSKLGSAAPAAQ